MNIYWARAVADQQITFVAEFAGQLDPSRLDRAFAALVHRQPILATVVHADGKRLRRAPAQGYTPSAIIIHDCADPMRDLVRFVSRPCNPTSEPPLKLLLLHHDGVDTLCLKVDHVLADAVGVGHLFAQLAAEYSGDIETPEINDDRGLGQVLSAVPPLDLIKAAFAMTLPKPPEPLGPSARDGAEPFIAHVTIEPERLARLHEFARSHGATINDLLLTVYFRAAFARRHEPARASFPMMVPVDLRRYLAPERRRAIANLSSAVFPELEAVADECFAATLARVAARMADLKAASPGLASAVLIEIGSLFGGIMMRQRYGNPGPRTRGFICMTNIGVIDEACAAFAGAEAKRVYFVGPAQQPPGFLIAVSSFRSTLHLLIQGNGDSAYQAFIRRFLEEVLQAPV